MATSCAGVLSSGVALATFFLPEVALQRTLLTVAAASLAVVQALNAQAPTIAPTPLVSIGSADGDNEYSLHRVSHLRRLSDGRILVTMGPDIRFYDVAGKFLFKAGGAGRGPGEFQYIQDILVLPGDTLLVLNIRERVWLAPDGKYVRREAIDFGPLSTDGWFSEGAVFLPGGDLLATQHKQQANGGERGAAMIRPVLRYAIYSPASGAVRPIMESAGLRQMRVGEHNSIVQPFTPHAQAAIGRDRVYVGDNDTTFVNVFDLEGASVGRVAVATTATKVTAQDLERYRLRILEFAGANAERKARFEEGWSVVEKPKRHPYWERALVARDGGLWVAAPDRLGQARAWTVFDRKGAQAGIVIMPQRFAPFEIGDDYILGVARDDDDVEFVRMYRLDRRAR